MSKKKRPLPKPGDTINCDPNRDEPDIPWRWTNVNRQSARVVDVITDERSGEQLIVYATWSATVGWRWHVMDSLAWQHSTQWAIGPLPRKPTGEEPRMEKP